MTRPATGEEIEMGLFRSERDKWDEQIGVAEDRHTRLTKQARLYDAAGMSKHADDARRCAQEDVQMAQRMRGCPKNPRNR